MDEHDYTDEFSGEVPAYAEETRQYLPGTKLEVAGTFICSTCPTPERTYHDLNGDKTLPECPRCGPETRWEKT